MSAYWAGTAQLLAVLVLAFVVEVRGISRTWRETADWTTPVIGIASVVALSGTGWVIAESLKASLPGARPRPELIPLAQAAVAVMISSLVMPPALTVLIRSFSRPLAAMLLFLSPRFRRIRRDLRAARRVAQIARKKHARTARNLEILIASQQRQGSELRDLQRDATRARENDAIGRSSADLVVHHARTAQLMALRHQLAQLDSEITEAATDEQERRRRFESILKLGREWLRGAFAGFPDSPGEPPWEVPTKRSVDRKVSPRVSRSPGSRALAERRRKGSARRRV